MMRCVVLPDAFAVDLVGVAEHAEREVRKDCDLVLRVEAIDIERGIRLREAELLRLLERLLQGQRALLDLRVVEVAEDVLGHAREDVVARTVENAREGLDFVAGDVTLHHANDGHAAANGRLEAERNAALAGGGSDLRPVGRERTLVRRNDVLACSDRIKDVLTALRGIAGQLDDDLNVRVGDDVAPAWPNQALEWRGAGALGRRRATLTIRTPGAFAKVREDFTADVAVTEHANTDVASCHQLGGVRLLELKRRVKRVDGLIDVRTLDDNGDTDFAGGDHLDVDSVVAERTKHTGSVAGRRVDARPNNAHLTE